ncbi:MAG: TonB-dependent receptor, partial [Gammaproteobacteria bacterium]|nr:TonB-dependent receptor [Gammaproteobacteria bacterium]
VVKARDLDKVVPGFTYTKAPRGTPIYTLRGIGFDDNSLASAPAVSTYLNEVPMAYPVMTRYAVFDLQRVEVLKGPQGILFGQNSTGGAINFIGAAPTEEFEAGANISYGRFNTIETQGFVSGALTPTLNARLSGMTINAFDGWQESYTRSDELGEQEIYSLRLQADWTPSDRLSVAFKFQGWYDGSDTQAGQLLEVSPSIDGFSIPDYDAYPRAPNDAQAADWDVDAFGRCGNNPNQVPPLAGNPPRCVTNAPYERNDNFMQPSVRIDYDINEELVLTSITSYSRYEQDFVQDTDASDLLNFNLNNFGLIQSWYQEVRLTGTTDSVDWVVGGNYTNESSEDTTYYFFPENSVNPGFLGIFQAFSSADQDVENYAIFGNVAWRFADDLTLNLGARYTRDEREYSGCTGDVGDGSEAAAFEVVVNFVVRPTLGLPPTASIPPGGCTVSDAGVPGIINRQLDEDNVSWRVGLDWEVNDDLLAYFNVSRGYKSGSIPAVNTASALQVQPVVQEEVTAFEGGFKSVLFDNRVQFNAAGFYYDYKDKQLRGRIADPFGIFGILETLLNIPESEVYGFEMGINAVPMEGLSLTFNTSYTHTEVTGDFFAVGPTNVDRANIDASTFNYKGQPFPHSPEWSITAAAQYEFPIMDGYMGFVGMNALYQSETEGLFRDPALVGATVASPTLRPGQTVDPSTFDIDSYVTVDVRGGFETADGKWRAWAWARNVFDEYYWNNATQNLDNFYRLASMPRTYGVSLQYRY